jgi:uncharacterized protein (DUF1800 family)
MKANLNLYSLIIGVCMCSLVSNYTKAQSTLNNLTNTVTISTLNPIISESWPSPAVVVIRRTGDLRAITVPLVISGTATPGLDYHTYAGRSVTIPMGLREVWVQFVPQMDNLVEGPETIIVTLQSSPAYNIGTQNSTQITINDSSTFPVDAAASRFLIQAGFGADPDEVAKVKALGYSAWIDQQLTRPYGYTQPIFKKRKDAGLETFHPVPKIGLWTKMMRRTPAGQADTTDILRLRVAYSLLQILVISEKVDALKINPEGVMNYFDVLMKGAFGNFRQTLSDVTFHPCMGNYLSSVGNLKPDPILKTFPDQNYAREVMQLFSIGLWELNQDGTRKLVGGNPIPTYNSADIAEFSRVYTGLRYGGPENDASDPGKGYEDYIHPMKLNESNHDKDSKKLLKGTTLPAGQSALQDINGALDNLFNHPNVGPFISKQLIQRLVTSNPSPAYVSRVAAKFNNDGKNVRGNMGAVVKAILMDDEARSFNKTLEPTFGKLREPYLGLMDYAKTFNAQNISGDYESATYLYDTYLEEPFESPSVFNFYSPTYRSPGQITALGIFSPEFQILTAVTALESHNLLYKSIYGEIGLYDASAPEDKIILKYDNELPLAGDPDALITELSNKLTGGTIRPSTAQIIREAVLQIPVGSDNWESERVRMAVYLVGTSAEFNVQK